jgi:hypothetical protein
MRLNFWVLNPIVYLRIPYSVENFVRQFEFFYVIINELNEISLIYFHCTINLNIPPIVYHVV